MLDFWQQGEDSDRQTRVDGGLILVGDSECRKRMDDRRQKENVKIVLFQAIQFNTNTQFSSI